MTGLANALSGAVSPQTPRRCPFGRLIDSLDTEDRVALEKSLSDGIMSLQAILQILQSVGLRSSRMTISAHRSGTCTCEPSG